MKQRADAVALERRQATSPRTPRQLLVFNAGSSSLKFQLCAPGAARAVVRGAVRDIGSRGACIALEGGRCEPLAGADTAAAAAQAVMERVLGGARAGDGEAPVVLATAHRVVHGGDRFTSATLVTDDVVARLREIESLAPLHNPAALDVMRVVRARLPEAPMVAVFDTAFFRALPEVARLYAIPRDWPAAAPVERYGFHGIAHEYLARRVAQISARPLARVLTLQLGQGCSITALRDGKPVETSMGFTPLEGLIMGTRCGDVDAGALLHALRQGMSWQELDASLTRESGLLALSGVSGDMRELLALEAQGHAGAQRAVEAFCHRIGKYVGAYAAVLGGVDAIAFGGGIGEHAASIRARVCAYLRWLGLELDEAANAAAVGAEGRLSAAGSAIEAYCILVREEDLIARAAADTLDGSAGALGRAPAARAVAS